LARARARARGQSTRALRKKFPSLLVSRAIRSCGGYRDTLKTRRYLPGFPIRADRSAIRLSRREILEARHAILISENLSARSRSHALDQSFRAESGKFPRFDNSRFLYCLFPSPSSLPLSLSLSLSLPVCLDNEYKSILYYSGTSLKLGVPSSLALLSRNLSSPLPGRFFYPHPFIWLDVYSPVFVVSVLDAR